MAYKIRLPHLAIVRAPGLLPMLYTLRELEKELGIPYSTLRDWLRYGAPHERDNKGHLWINGELFSDWIKFRSQPKVKRKLKDGEGYCMHCREVRQLVDPDTRQIKGNLIHIRGTCPICGERITRGGWDDS